MTDETPDAPRPEDGPADDALPEHEVERLRALLAAPAAPVDVLERARLAALAAFDDVHMAGDATAAPVSDLGTARAQKTTQKTSHKAAWYQRVPLGAAAAVVAAVALVGVFSQLDLSSSDGDDMATAALDADDSGDSGGESGDSAYTAEDEASLEESAALDGDASEGFGGDGQSSPAAGSMRAAVVYPDVDALVGDYQRRFEAGDDSTAGGGTGAPSDTTSSAAEFENSSCDPVDAAGVDPDRVVTTDPVQLGGDGEPVAAFAVVYESETSRLRVAVVDEASCEVRADRAL